MHSSKYLHIMLLYKARSDAFFAVFTRDCVLDVVTSPAVSRKEDACSRVLPQYLDEAHGCSKFPLKELIFFEILLCRIC